MVSRYAQSHDTISCAWWCNLGSIRWLRVETRASHACAGAPGVVFGAASWVFCAAGWRLDLGFRAGLNLVSSLRAAIVGTHLEGYKRVEPSDCC